MCAWLISSSTLQVLYSWLAETYVISMQAVVGDLSRKAMDTWTLALIIVFTFMTMNQAIGLVLQCVLLYGILKVLFDH